MAKLTNELEETKAELERTKAKLQFDQGIRGVLPRDSSENLESPTSNEQMTMKETCEDKLSEKKCKKLKKKKNGKGCQTKSTQKKCTKTCELCPPDGKFGVIHYLMSYPDSAQSSEARLFSFLAFLFTFVFSYEN